MTELRSWESRSALPLDLTSSLGQHVIVSNPRERPNHQFIAANKRGEIFGGHVFGSVDTVVVSRVDVSEEGWVLAFMEDDREPLRIALEPGKETI